MTPRQQALLDTWVLSGVVGNGGFDAWVRSNGHRAKQTISGLRLLGEADMAEVVQTVIAVTGDVASPAAGDTAIDNLSAEDSELLDRLSEKVWAADDSLDQAMVRALLDAP